MKEEKLESISLEDFLDSYIGSLIYNCQGTLFEAISNLEQRMAEVRLALIMAKAGELSGSVQPLASTISQAKEIITEEIPEEIWMDNEPPLKNLIKMMRWVDENLENNEYSVLLTISNRISPQDMFDVDVAEMGFNEDGIIAGTVRAIDGEICLFTVEKDGLLTLENIKELKKFEGMSIFTYLKQEAVNAISETIDKLSCTGNEEKEEGFAEYQKRSKKHILS